MLKFCSEGIWNIQMKIFDIVYLHFIILYNFGTFFRLADKKDTKCEIAC